MPSTNKNGLPVTIAFPRPLLAGFIAIGAIASLKFRRAGVALFSLGVIGLGVLHGIMYNAIRGMCVEACEKGDMSDIPANWQIPGET